MELGEELGSSMQACKPYLRALDFQWPSPAKSFSKTFSGKGIGLSIGI